MQKKNYHNFLAFKTILFSSSWHQFGRAAAYLFLILIPLHYLVVSYIHSIIYELSKCQTRERCAAIHRLLAIWSSKKKYRVSWAFLWSTKYEKVIANRLWYNLSCQRSEVLISSANIHLAAIIRINKRKLASCCLRMQARTSDLEH